MFVITIFDNGPGMSEEELSRIQSKLQGSSNARTAESSAGGLGIWNVHERVRMYYGGSSGLTVSSLSGEGTTVVLTMEQLEGGASR